MIPPAPHPLRWSSDGRRWILPHIDGDDDVQAGVCFLSASDADPRPVVRVAVFPTEEDPTFDKDGADVAPFVGYIEPQELADMLASHGYVGVAREIPS